MEGLLNAAEFGCVVVDKDESMESYIRFLRKA